MISHRFILNQRWLWAGTAVLAMLLLVTFLGGVNLWLFHIGNAVSLYTGGWLWANLTLLGDTLIVLALLLPFVARRPELIWTIMVSAFLVSIAVHLGKEFIDSPRPAGMLPREELHLIGYVATSSSFPSGHTAAAFTLAAGLCLLPGSRRLKLVSLLLAALVGLSRVAVGIHWPTDVFGGALLGWLGAGVGAYLAARMRFGVGLLAQRIQAGILVLLAVFTLLYHDGGYPQGRLLIMLLPLAMLLLAAPGLIQLFSPAGSTRKD
jgi:membrane-associated phospholipid phosphatase